MDESKFFETAYRIINKYNAASKKPRKYGKDQMILYSAETHMIEVIGSAQKITTSQLAQNMAVTKGAVSQITAKLLQKGLIEKEAFVKNPHAFYVVLSPLGQEVYEEHRKFHEQMTHSIGEIYSKMSMESKVQLQEMIKVLDHMLDQ